MIQFLFLLGQSWAEDAHRAADAAHAGEHGIPWGSLFVQSFNFAVLFIILFWLMRKAVGTHFDNRVREYRQMVERAEAAHKEAETAKLEVEQRLAKLQAGAERTAQDAKAEAEGLKARLIEEARQLSRKLEEEAQRTASIELEKAKAELRRELLERSLESSRENMRKNLGSKEQEKLQNEFVEKIQVVGQ